MQFTLPYGKTVRELSIPDGYHVELVIGETQETPDFEVVVKNAFSHPLQSPPLTELARSGDNVVIVVDDHTRPCPSKQLLPFVLNELKKAHVSASDITILIATGTHTPPSHEQLIELLGKNIVQQYTVVSNDNQNSSYVSIGTSSFGHNISIHKLYVEADVKIILSDIEYHYFAGYGGTRKSILPGIASGESIQLNHAMMFDDHATTGELNRNPISIEMQEALDMIGCDFCVGAVLNPNHEIVGLWTGEAHQVMKEGVHLVDTLFTKKIRKKPDVIITASDGYPHDINLYQALKAIHSAAQVIKDDGSIVLSAECEQGMGNKIYQDWLKTYDSADEIKKKLTNHFQIGAHKAYYHREITNRSTVYLTSGFNPSFVKTSLGFKPVQSIQEGFDKIVTTKKEIEQILIMPQGSTTRIVL